MRGWRTYGCARYYGTNFVCCLVFHLLFLSTNSQAQRPVSLPFDALNIDDGLSQGFIGGIVQDRQGFMWFATGDGLNKYDGASFKIYHHDPDDSTSLASDDLTCVLEDSKGRFWVGTRNHGLDLFDRENNIFYHIRHRGKNSIRSDNILGIVEDKRGTLWIRTKQGVDRLNVSKRAPETKSVYRPNAFPSLEFSFTAIHMDTAQEAAREKYSAEKVFVDSKNQVLITTPSGIWQVHTQSANSKYSIAKRYSYAVVDSTVVPDILEDTVQHCLLLNMGKIIKFPNNDFSKAREIFRYAHFRQGWVIDKHFKLWVADQNRIILLDLRTEIVEFAIPADPLHIKAINSPTVYYTDKTGVIWIGSGGFGLLKYDLEKKLFHHVLRELNPYQMVVNKSGEIVTNTFKTIRIKPNKEIAVNDMVDYRTFQKSFPKLGVVSFAMDQEENIWTGIHGGLLKYTATTKEVIRFDIPFKDLETQPFPVFLDSKKQLWMGYNKYLVKFNPTTRKFQRFEYPPATKSYDYDLLQCVYEDNGHLWLGLINGLVSFNMATGVMEKYYDNQENDSFSLSNNFVYSICNDAHEPEKYLWVGTKGGGLNQLDKHTGKFTRYSIKNGLANNVVYGILPDNDGNLWLSTNKGLSRLDPITKTFRNFNVGDGLQSNEFNRYAYCKTPGGVLVFGGMNGINYFDPDEIKSLDPPEVIFTDFKLFNRSSDLRTPGFRAKKNISYVRSIELSYDQNIITFLFAGLDYRKQGSIRYRYKMEGFDKNWIYSGAVREATYTNLDPGRYRFIVQSSFVNGSWGNSYASIKLRIIPPWNRTWWFYIVSTTSTILITYIIYRYRLKQILKFDSLRDRIARDLHDEVGSSISTIAIYSKIVHEQIGTTDFNNEPLLKKISEHATEIMDSMNDIVWNINTRNDEFSNIVARMKDHAYQLLEAKGYLLHFSFDENLNKTKLEMDTRRDFYLIYKESINNIAKYANGQNVWITMELRNSEIILQIKDDGIGFDMEVAKEKSNGIRNMRFRAVALKAELDIRSVPGQGTELYLHLPRRD